MKISVSEVGSFLDCRQAWDYDSVNRQHLTPAVGDEPQPLYIGHAVHAALERYYQSGCVADPADYALEWCYNQAKEWGGITEGQKEDAQLAALMVRGYVNEYMEWNGSRYADRWGIEFLQNQESGDTVLEQQFQVSISDTDDGWLVGTLDGLIRDQEGRSWIIDHKTCKAFPDFRISDMDVQFLGYTWAAQRMSNAGMLQRFGVPKGAQIHGVLYNGLRKQKPGPRVTAPLFMRQYIQHSKQELMYFDSWLQDIYAEMQSPKVYPHPSWKCGTCPFYTPCLARQRGDDEEYLLRTLYRVKESRGQVYDPDS